MLTIQAPVATALRRRSSIAFRVFRFLYFCPLEDDLDLEEEVEEERRR